jgi:hypothetical protein
LDRIRDAYTIGLIGQIGEHYQTNISNRFLRPVLLQLPLDKNTWDQIENLTKKNELYRYEGFHIDELYRQVVAAARFVEAARRELPTLRNRLNVNAHAHEKVHRDMAANNFVSNLQFFAELVNKLYTNLVEIDNNDPDCQPPVYLKIPELMSIEHQLTSRF